VRLAFAFLLAALLAACDSKPLDWNNLTASRIRDQVPGAEVIVIDANTLEVKTAGKSQRVDTKELQTRCNRGPRDCDYAFDQIVTQLRGAEALK
jgi:hypothetical protein